MATDRPTPWINQEKYVFVVHALFIFKSMNQTNRQVHVAHQNIFTFMMPGQTWQI